MLENVSSLKVQGGYFVEETDDFPLFQNTINILYGRNGSGKSSISRAIREFSKNGDEDSENRNIQLVSMRILISRQSMCLMKILLRKKF